MHRLAQRLEGLAPPADRRRRQSVDGDLQSRRVTLQPGGQLRQRVNRLLVAFGGLVNPYLVRHDIVGIQMRFKPLKQLTGLVNPLILAEHVQQHFTRRGVTGVEVE